MSAKFPNPSKLCEVDICVLLRLALPLGPDTALGPIGDVEAMLTPGIPELPLHASALKFGLNIHLACAVCIGIVTIIPTAAVTRTKVTAAIVTEDISGFFCFSCICFKFLARRIHI